MITSLTSLLNYVSCTKVLVIGDIMLDHYIWGDVHRISPEAPVPIVHVTRDTYTAGGAANVALNLANLGVRTSVIGYCAQDEAGQRLLQILANGGVEFLQTQRLFDTPTIIKTRVVIRNQQLCRIDREVAPESYSIKETPEFDEMLDIALSDVDAVIISDYAKGVVTQPLVDFVLKKARRRSDLLVAVDPKPSRHLLYCGVDLITPNHSESLEMAAFSTEYHVTSEHSLAEVSQRIHETHKPQLLIITLSEKGMAICQEGKVVEHLPTEAREVFDVSGAGDTVIATLTAALAAGANPSQAARLANIAAGCVISHMGTVPINLEELKDWINRLTEQEVSAG